MRDDAARLLVSGWREYNIYIYICISVESSSLLKTIIYIYINMIVVVVVVAVSKILVRARRVSRVLVQLHVNTQHRSYLHDRCRMTQIAQLLTGRRSRFIFYSETSSPTNERSSPWSFELTENYYRDRRVQLVLHLLVIVSITSINLDIFYS